MPSSVNVTDGSMASKLSRNDAVITGLRRMGATGERLDKGKSFDLQACIALNSLKRSVVVRNRERIDLLDVDADRRAQGHAKDGVRFITLQDGFHGVRAALSSFR